MFYRVWKNGKNDISKQSVSFAVANTDEATIQPTEKTVYLILKEQDYPTVKLDSEIDGESLIYDSLQAIDNEKYKGSSLVYFNNDEVL